MSAYGRGYTPSRRPRSPAGNPWHGEARRADRGDPCRSTGRAPTHTPSQLPHPARRARHPDRGEDPPRSLVRQGVQRRYRGPNPAEETECPAGGRRSPGHRRLASAGARGGIVGIARPSVADPRRVHRAALRRTQAHHRMDYRVMMPTAYTDGKEPVGLSFVFGFARLAFLRDPGSLIDHGHGRSSRGADGTGCRRRCSPSPSSAHGCRTTLATLPMHRPWRGPESLVDNTVHESVREVLKTLLTYAVDAPDASAAIAREGARRPVPRRAAAVGDARRRHDRGRRGGRVPGVWVRPPGRPRGHDPLPPRRRLPRDHAVDVHDVHRRARAGHRVRPVHRRLPAGARVPVPRRARRRDRRCSRRCSTHGRHRERARSSRATRAAGGSRRRCSRTRAPHHLPEPAGAVLFSPEVDLVMGEPSVTATRARRAPRRDPGAWLPRRASTRTTRWSRSCTPTSSASRRPSSRTAATRCSATRSRVRRQLRDADVDVESFEAPHLFHVYEILMPWANASKDTIAAVGVHRRPAVADRLSDATLTLGDRRPDDVSTTAGPSYSADRAGKAGATVVTVERRLRGFS